jgi:hypothetical protein
VGLGLLKTTPRFESVFKKYESVSNLIGRDRKRRRGKKKRRKNMGTKEKEVKMNLSLIILYLIRRHLKM